MSAKANNTAIKTPDQRLIDAAALFMQRNKQYGDNYRTIGPVLAAMFPDGLHVGGAEEMQRVFTIVMVVMKITRYAQNIDRGGHQDSLDDMSVYSMMAAYTDELDLQITKSMAQEPLSTRDSGSLVGYPFSDSLGWCLIYMGVSARRVRELAKDGYRLRRRVWGVGQYVDGSNTLLDDENHDWEIWQPPYTLSAPEFRGAGTARD